MVHGDFFDGEEFQPQIMTDRDTNALPVPSEPEEVVNDFGDNENNFAMPIPDDQS